jgi:hypothetical protein
VQLICLGLGRNWSWPPRSCRAEECPHLTEFTCLIKFLASAGMYTKFSTELSIKYPPDTEYPMPTGRALGVEMKAPLLFEGDTTMKEMRCAG